MIAGAGRRWGKVGVEEYIGWREEVGGGEGGGRDGEEREVGK